MPRECGRSRQGLDYYKYLANRHFPMNAFGCSSPLASSFVEMPSMDIVQAEEEWGHAIIEEEIPPAPPQDIVRTPTTHSETIY
jgi:hypothetical protein